MKSAHRKAAHAKRRVIANPTAWLDAVVSSRPPSNDHATTVMNRIRTAFEALKNGSVDPVQFDRLAATINVGLIRAEAIDPFLVQSMVAAIDALRRCDEIFGRHRRYGFHGPDLAVVMDAIDVYEEILRNSTPHQMEAAVHESARRMIAQVREEQAGAAA